MRTTLTIDNDAYDTVMHIAVVSGERPGKVVSRLIRKALQAQPAKIGSKRRFPTFPVKPGARNIEALKVQRLIDDEGII